MALPKSILLYTQLSAIDKVKFKDLVYSPFFNKREKVKKIFDFIEMHYLEDEPTWNRQAAHSYVFGNSIFNALQINNLLSDLYYLQEKFLVNLQLEIDTELHSIVLMESIVGNGVKNTNDFLLQKKNTKSGISNYYSNYKFNQLADRFQFQKTRKSDTTFLRTSQKELDLFYLCAQLKMWCELLNRNNVLALEYDHNQLNKFELFLAQYLDEYKNEPYVLLYYPVFVWQKDPSQDAWYKGYLQKLFLHLTQLPKLDGKEICNYIQNYCVKRINEDHEFFLQELFEVFKFMLLNDLANEGSNFPQWTYKNIVTVGVRLKEFEWTENFIHQYYTKLAVKDSDNAYQYNLAVLHFESGKLDRALQRLNKVHFTDPIYYLDAKAILLKIYFDRELDDAIHALRDSVKIYLLRDKVLNKTQKLSYKNLFTYTIQLFKLKYESAHLKESAIETELIQLKEEVLANNTIANRKWLLQKIAFTNGKQQ